MLIHFVMVRTEYTCYTLDIILKILGSSGVLQLNIDDLKQACDDFNPSKKIGKGGFGEVFRGYFQSTNIAIKLVTDVHHYKLFEIYF